MFAIAILFFIGLYLLLSAGVVYVAVRIARRTGRSAKKWGLIMAFMMWLIPFWDWLPTVIAHQYYCRTEAGFWVYKTLGQWKAENPGEYETLINGRKLRKISKDKEEMHGKHGSISTYYNDERINWVVKRKIGPYFINIWEWEQALIDSKNGEVLSKLIDFKAKQSVEGDAWKLWLTSDGCKSLKLSERNSFLTMREQFTGE